MKEQTMNKHIQAFVNNISFPRTLEELYSYLSYGQYNVEDILYDQYVEWTAPGWAKRGDIVFFMHAKTVRSIITGLRTELKNSKSSYSDADYTLLNQWLERGLDLHQKYGGKIFGIGVVVGPPEIESTEEAENRLVHWKSRIYAEIEIVSVLQNPVDVSEFREFFEISRRGAITPVVGSDFVQLRAIISKKNCLPPSVMQCDATPLPLSKINDTNWMMVTKDYRRSFILEIQFRRYYVDYLLRLLGSRKKFYSECRCHKAGAPYAFVDNIIMLGQKYLPVEVKLLISTQRNLPNQLDKYCGNDEIILDKKGLIHLNSAQIYDNRVLVIDTEAIYLYDGYSKDMETLCDLDSLSEPSDVANLKSELQKRLN